ERIAALGVPLASLRLLGGGARSRAWAAIRADGRRVDVGLHADLAAASAALPGPAETLAPDPAQRELHDAGHARYRELAARLGNVVACPGSRGTGHV
ncbi:MAG: hypothetical protein K8M05_17280, partial [Deltaproteobacteria bacterium]|nr:hypothetical protein [Kofleriaceae bacterium]